MGRQQGKLPRITPTMPHSDRLLQRHQLETLRRAHGPRALSRRRTPCSRTPCSTQAREQDFDHRDRRRRGGQQLHSIKTLSHLGFTSVPQTVGGLHQLDRLHSRARRVNLQAVKLPRVSRSIFEARKRRRTTSRLPSSTVSLKAGEHGTTVVVAVATAGRTGKRVRRHVPVHTLGRARTFSQRRRRLSKPAPAK